MGKIKEHKSVKLVVGMFTNKLKLFQDVLRVLEKKFGPVDYENPLFTFDKTDYYDPEFGKDLKRKFYSFKKLIKAEDLPGIKIFTNSCEKKFCEKGKRTINLDPGYLTPAKLVLATTRDYQHRIYYGKGIYGEVTLRYRQGSFIPWEWTYPDYRTKEYIEVFTHIRKIYMEQLK